MSEDTFPESVVVWRSRKDGSLHDTAEAAVAHDRALAVIESFFLDNPFHPLTSSETISELLESKGRILELYAAYDAAPGPFARF